MTPRIAIAAAAAVVLLALGAYLGWTFRDSSAQRATAALLAAQTAELERQAGINSRTENFLRDQLDRANAANADVHLGSVRCVVSLRSPTGNLPPATPATGVSDAAAADGDAVAGIGRDIGPDLERWAGGQLTQERERLRACQHYAAEVSAQP